MARAAITGRRRCGFSITDAIVAMVVVSIAVLGTMSLRYQSSLDARRAEVGTAAARLALMMVETWRGVAGTETFDPVSSFSPDVSIEQEDGPDAPEGYSLLNTYRVQVSDVNYYAALSYKDINADLRELSVQVYWQQRGDAAAAEEADKSFAVSAYVLK